MFPPELESTKHEGPRAPRADIYSATEPRRKTSRRGETVLWLCMIGIFWLLALVHGFGRRAVVIAGVASVLFATVWFLEVRSRDQKASRSEIVVATAWRWVRIIVGFAALIVLGAPPVAAIVLGAPLDGGLLLAMLISIASAALAVWVGIYGSYTLGGDPQVHSARKRRYGWWI